MWAGSYLSEQLSHHAVPAAIQTSVAELTIPHRYQSVPEVNDIRKMIK